MSKTYLDKVYGARDVDSTRALYDDWADSYDAEVGGEGYATPARIAAALADILPQDSRLLDFGCGTGLSGLALTDAGFTRVDGCDMSSGMLEKAKARGVYSTLRLLDGSPPDAALFAGYDAIVACGVISAGAAPASTLPAAFDALAPGANLALSYNSHTLDDADYIAALDAVLARPDATLRFSEDGPHLPGLGMTSRVMILAKA